MGLLKQKFEITKDPYKIDIGVTILFFLVRKKEKKTLLNVYF